MSAYKKLNKQDAYITTYVAHKKWVISGSEFGDYGIQIIPYLTGTYLSGVQQLYYPPKISGSLISHSFDNYLDSTLHNPSVRNLQEGSFLISIPQRLFGVELNPESEIDLSISQVQQTRYVSGSYWGNNYSYDPIENVPVNLVSMVDDGEGGIYLSGSLPRYYIGDIIYPHGMIIITDPGYATTLQNAWYGENPFEGDELNPFKPRPVTRGNIVLTWQSSQPIYTHTYHCRIRDFELNYTFNPSTISSSFGTVYDNEVNIYSTSSKVNTGIQKNNVTGSSFTPYITTVGLYNDANQLIAVGKLNRPVPKPQDTDMTIIVKIDI